MLICWVSDSYFQGLWDCWQWAFCSTHTLCYCLRWRAVCLTRRWIIYDIILYCIILYLIISYYIILCYIVLYYIFYYIISYVILYYIVLYYILYYIILYYRFILYIVIYRIILYIILHYNVSYRIILYITLYHILYYIILLVLVWSANCWHYIPEYIELRPWRKSDRVPYLWFSGAFAKLRKATVNCIMSVCSYASNNSASTAQIFMKFDIWVFLQNLLRKLKFH